MTLWKLSNSITCIHAAALHCAISLRYYCLGTATGQHYVELPVESGFRPSTNPDSAAWKRIPATIADRGRFGEAQREARTEIRSRWTSQNLYFLFVSHYETLYLKSNPSTEQDTWGLWDYEVFIGHDLENIHLYKEFEVSPQGEWVDLDVDRKRAGREVDASWNSGFRSQTQIDRGRKVWISEMQITWNSIHPGPITDGTELRLNLYRIEGGPVDRKFIAWQPVMAESYHTPERFGRLLLVN